MSKQRHENGEAASPSSNKSAIRKAISTLKTNLGKDKKTAVIAYSTPVFYHFDPEDLENLQKIGKEISMNLAQKEKKDLASALMVIKDFLMK
jgi:hypothetical protein